AVSPDRSRWRAVGADRADLGVAGPAGSADDRAGRTDPSPAGPVRRADLWRLAVVLRRSGDRDSRASHAFGLRQCHLTTTEALSTHRQGARMTTPTQISIPGYAVGTWVFDLAHSEVSFQVRHLGVAKVRRRFDDSEGTSVTADNPLDSSVNAVIRTASVNTNTQMRDDNLRQADFLNVERY